MTSTLADNGAVGIAGLDQTVSPDDGVAAGIVAVVEYFDAEVIHDNGAEDLGGCARA